MVTIGYQETWRHDLMQTEEAISLALAAEELRLESGSRGTKASDSYAIRKYEAETSAKSRSTPQLNHPTTPQNAHQCTSTPAARSARHDLASTSAKCGSTRVLYQMLSSHYETSKHPCKIGVKLTKQLRHDEFNLSSCLPGFHGEMLSFYPSILGV